jgi:HlyD family secretion protein
MVKPQSENGTQKETTPSPANVPPPAGGEPKAEEIARLAYHYSQERLHPNGTGADEDWFRAEREITQRNNGSTKSAEPVQAEPVRNVAHDGVHAGSPDSEPASTKEAQANNAIAGDKRHRYLKLAVGMLLLVIVAIAAYFIWQHFRPKPLGEGFASGNGRIEAVDLDVAAKSPGRISDMLVNDGDFVTAGQIVARMDTAVLQAELQQARAQETEARNAMVTALAIVGQRESEHAASLAVVTQREAEQVVAKKTAERSRVLSAEHAASVQEFDNDVANQKRTTAAVLSSKAQAAASQATTSAARSQVLEAGSRIAATLATENRIRVEIADGVLKAPRDGRVQFRIAQPGEVVPAGGKVLSMVDLSDVSMTFFLPETVAGRVAIGSEVHIVLDAAPQNVIPATVSFIANVAQFTPKTVETENERQKLVFRIKATIDPALLRKNIAQVKSGVPGVAYVHLDPSVAWPEKLRTRIPQ